MYIQSCQYRDFVSHLPETLMIKVMSFVPAKDILKRCCLVSQTRLKILILVEVKLYLGFEVGKLCAKTC